jgi:CRP-like cAMP-binding protein
MKRRTGQGRQAALASLRQMSLFREVDPEHLVPIVPLARNQSYGPGEVVVHQGDEGNSVFSISAGFLKVAFSSPSGSHSTLTLMGPGEIFGELSLLDGGRRSATVTALTRCELIAIDRGPFLATLRAHPQVGIAVMEVVARRLRRLSERSDDLSGQPVGTRLAKQLLALAENHGYQLGPGRLRLGMKLSQRELGELIGATRESVNKQIGLWKDEGVVSDDDGYVVVTNLALLRSIADYGGNRPSE